MSPRWPLSRQFRLILPVLVGALLVLLVARVIVVRRPSRSSDQVPPGTAGRATAPSRAPAQAPPARVPAAKPLTLRDIPAPVPWMQLASANPPPRLDFTMDLDFFAPLGDGPGNAAIWFRDFARHDGSRWAEPGDLDLTSVSFFGTEQKVYPPDHPLLREAEPWVNQAICRFYPDIWKPEGVATPVPNLRFAITLARSWVARGYGERDPERAREDYRRAIRLGRLFMQDDAEEIQHLVGWACVSYGLRGLNDLARREGDGAMVAATTLELTDHDAMRSLVAQWSTELRLDGVVRRAWWGGWTVSLRSGLADRAIAHAGSNPLRCLRAAALLPLELVRHEGTPAQREQAAAILAGLAHGPDPWMAAYARWYEERPYNRGDYAFDRDE